MGMLAYILNAKKIKLSLKYRRDAGAARGSLAILNGCVTGPFPSYRA